MAISLRGNITFEYNTGDTLPTLGVLDKGVKRFNLDTQVLEEWDGSAWGDSGGGGVTDHTLLTNIGVNTHTQIDDHIGDITGNPHQLTAWHVGLDQADNTSDADKPISTLQQTALDGKVGTVSDQALATTAALSINGTDLTLTKGDATFDTVILPIIDDHTALSNIGTNSHIDIDNHIGNTSNPHGVTASQLGLGPTTWSSTTVIPLSNYNGAYNNEAVWNATYTFTGAVLGGFAVAIIDTTGQTVFPTITGATLLTGSSFVADSIFEMQVYTTDGTNVFYYFIERA